MELAEDRFEHAYGMIDLALDLGFDLEFCWIEHTKHGWNNHPVELAAFADLSDDFLFGDWFGEDNMEPSAVVEGYEVFVRMIHGAAYYHGDDGRGGEYVRSPYCEYCDRGLCEAIGGRMLVCSCVKWIWRKTA
jgi:hypothetical protein